jgi:outer membrane receptor for monomeric catechols
MNAEATATLTVSSGDNCACPGAATNWVINMTHSCNITTNCDITTGYLNFTDTGYARFNATINCTGMQKPASGQTIYIEKNALITVH